MRIVKSIASADSLTARAAMTELSDIIESPDKQAVLRDYEEMFIQSVSAQFKVFHIKIFVYEQKLKKTCIFYLDYLTITYLRIKDYVSTITVNNICIFHIKIIRENIERSQFKKYYVSTIGLIG